MDGEHSSTSPLAGIPGNCSRPPCRATIAVNHRGRSLGVFIPGIYPCELSRGMVEGDHCRDYDAAIIHRNQARQLSTPIIQADSPLGLSRGINSANAFDLQPGERPRVHIDGRIHQPRTSESHDYISSGDYSLISLVPFHVDTTFAARFPARLCDARALPRLPFRHQNAL